MDFHACVRRQLRSDTTDPAADDDPAIVDELAQHLGDLYQEARAGGLDHDAALARAVAALPDRPDLLNREIVSASRSRAAVLAERWSRRDDVPIPGRFVMLSDLRRDLRYSVRMLARTPAFTLVVVLTLALGIGANAAIFSVVNAILLRDAPVADPARVVSVYTSSSDGRTQFSSSSYPDYVDLRDGSAFKGLAAYASITASFDGSDASEQVTGEIVSGNYFDVLGVSPALGRGFAVDEDRAGTPERVAVVSNSFWRRNLGSDPAAVGRDIRLNGATYTVVGVTPAGFSGPLLGRAPEIWVPLAMQPEMRPPSAGVRRQLGHANLLGVRDIRWLNMIGRLSSGPTRLQAQQEAAASVELLARRLELQYPDANRGRSFTVVRLGDGPGVRVSARPMLGVLSGAVLLVLLIACANVASLLAARAVSRRREVAIRMAVGAARGRMARQCQTETMLVAVLCAAGALLVARGFTPLLVGFGIPDDVDLSLDRRVFAFTMSAGIASGLLFGLAPVIQGLGRDTLTALRDEGGAIASGVRAARLRSAFVVLQVALSLMLLVAAGLFLRTLKNAYAVDLGYRTEGVLLADLNLDIRGYSPDAGQEVYRRVFESIAALPGVQNVGASRVSVLSGSARTNTISLDGRPVARDGSNGLTVRVNVTSDRYLETMGIPVLLGRSFQPSDDMRAPRVAIVSRSLATRMWPGQDPIGRAMDGGGGPLTVVGVVPDAVYVSAIERDPPPFFYVPLAQNYESGLTILVRTAGDPIALLPAVRQAVRQIDRQLALAQPRTLRDDFDRSVGDERLMATLVGLFGGLALLLAAVGLYGVMAHAAGQRRTEIGIRLALGASPSAILWMIVGGGLRLVAIGAAMGIAGALVASHALEHQLFGITAVDPATYVVVAVVLTVVAAVACAVPARRAMRVDPVVALKNA